MTWYYSELTPFRPAPRVAPAHVMQLGFAHNVEPSYMIPTCIAMVGQCRLTVSSPS